jgi:hypothetical protein
MKIMRLKNYNTKSFLFNDIILELVAQMETLKMTTTEANAKVIADMDEAQASFMAARAEKKKAEEMKMADALK